MKDQLHNEWLVDRRIATPDGTYPLCEARWGSIMEYVEYLEGLLNEYATNND